MLDAVLAHARARGWPEAQLHFERFAAAAPQAGDGSFELVLAQSGRTLTVSAHQTILDVLIDSGCDPMFDCQRGECGVCTTRVIEGEIEHRDHVLSPRERAAGDVIQTCVSRCRGPRLVLDL
jgi:vanillate O-demethylase ferredoxin subunit